MNFSAKIIVTFLVVFLSAVYDTKQSFAEESSVKTVTIDTKEVEGKLKAGVMLGYPTGITAGYRFSNVFELNGVLGSNYHDITAGVNGLFTLFNFDISGEIFPFSVGPGLYSHFDHHDGNDGKGNDDEYTKIDLLALARFEYNFKKIPLNLFAEAGLGLEVVKFADPAGSFAIGARYIF